MAEVKTIIDSCWYTTIHPTSCRYKKGHLWDGICALVREESVGQLGELDAEGWGGGKAFGTCHVQKG